MTLFKKLTFMLVFVFAFTCFFKGTEVTAKTITKTPGEKVSSVKTTSSKSAAVKKTTSNTKSTAAKKTTSKSTATKKPTSSKVKTSTAKKTSSSKSTPKTVSNKSKSSSTKGTTYKSTTKTSTKTTAKAPSKKTTATSKGTKNVTSRGAGAVVGSGNIEELISYAKKFIGVKYVFGGMSPKGFDCSGFTAYVYKAGGISLPHSASAQSKIGLAVSKSELKPGDLVFFETYTSGISHVGIYVGGGKFIHASSSKGITITSLSESYYAPRFRGATRIIK